MPDSQTQYQRLSDRSRKVMQFACREAFRLNHHSIGTEHVLLGLLIEGTGLTESVLRKIDRDFGRIRNELDKHIALGTTVPQTGTLPLRPDTASALEQADINAISHRFDTTHPEHLLIGIISTPGTVAADTLESLGIRADDVIRDLDESS